MASSRVGPIQVEGVSKRFRRGVRHDSLRDVIASWFSSASSRDTAAAVPRDFWALEDVSFTVAPGEVLGVIGANGAGKSTLLKLLTRVMRPTVGRIRTSGRLGALLELAAGFHPDLSGRENVFLQAAILGMPQREARRRFDEIVAFAGVEAFIDTPVKRYSSGMHARLGFSIAAHLEPDALIIDEVLSVGDFQFQARAYERMRQLARRGIPVVLVSHQLERLAEFCTTGIVLERGRVGMTGAVRECTAWYVSRAATASAPDPDAAVHLERIVLDGSDDVVSGQHVTVRIVGQVRDASRLASVEPVGLRLRSLGTGEVVSVTSSTRCGVPITRAGAFSLQVTLQCNVPAGPYAIEVHPWDRERERTTQPSLAATITVRDGASFVGRVQLNPRMVLESS